MKPNPYLTDFDLDGPRCECGQMVATHAPIAPPKSIALGRVDGETKPFNRHWRAQPYDPPPESNDVQPALTMRRGRKVDVEAAERVYAAIRIDPQHATYASVATALGSASTASVNQRLKRLARDGLLPADIVEWCKRRTRSRAKWDMGVW